MFFSIYLTLCFIFAAAMTYLINDLNTEPNSFGDNCLVFFGMFAIGFCIGFFLIAYLSIFIVASLIALIGGFINVTITSPITKIIKSFKQ